MCPIPLCVSNLFSLNEIENREVNYEIGLFLFSETPVGFFPAFKRLRSIHKGQFTLSTQLILLLDLVILSHRRSTTVSPETYTLYIAKPLTNLFPNTAEAFGSGKEKDKVSFFDSEVMLLTNGVWGEKSSV